MPIKSEHTHVSWINGTKDCIRARFMGVDEFPMQIKLAL